MGSTAHGIKGTKLAALDGSVYRLGSGIDEGDEARTRDSLKDMRQLVARLRKMVLDILYFAKERRARLEHSGRGRRSHCVPLFPRFRTRPPKRASP